MDNLNYKRTIKNVYIHYSRMKSNTLQNIIKLFVNEDLLFIQIIEDNMGINQNATY